MPAQYEAIRDKNVAAGMSLKEAKSRAAKIYIAGGKGGSRHSRAQALHADAKAGLKRAQEKR